MDIETQLAEVSRTFLVNYPKAWKQAEKKSQSERSRLADDYVRHKVRYEVYRATRPDALFWVGILSARDEKERQKRAEEKERKALDQAWDEMDSEAHALFEGYTVLPELPSEVAPGLFDLGDD